MKTSEKRIMQYFLWKDWHAVFGTTVHIKRTITLTIEDYVLCLEIIAEAENIQFESLLFYIFYDEEQKGFKKMWDKKFIKRTTATSIKKIMLKILKSLRVGESGSLIATQEKLDALKKQKVDYVNYEETKAFYEKIRAHVRELDEQSERRFRMDNWVVELQKLLTKN